MTYRNFEYLFNGEVKIKVWTHIYSSENRACVPNDFTVSNHASADFNGSPDKILSIGGIFLFFLKRIRIKNIERVILGRLTWRDRGVTDSPD